MYYALPTLLTARQTKKRWRHISILATALEEVAHIFTIGDGL